MCVSVRPDVHAGSFCPVQHISSSAVCCGLFFSSSPFLGLLQGVINGHKVIKVLGGRKREREKPTHVSARGKS